MKWFKHMTNMLEDSWVQDVFMVEHGIAGYGFICGIYEIYGKECGSNPGSWINVPIATVTRKLRVSATKVERLLSDCASAGKLTFEISLREVRINIPKMAELSDEYAKKKNKDVGTLSGENPPIEEDYKKRDYKTKKDHHGEVADATVCGSLFDGLPQAEKNKIAIPSPAKWATVSPGFVRFWEAYPKSVRKVEKARCFRKWKERKLEFLTDAILASLEAHKQTDQWRRDSGQFIPSPSVFINQSRWEAEIGGVELTQTQGQATANKHIDQLMAAKSLSKNKLNKFSENALQ